MKSSVTLSAFAALVVVAGATVASARPIDVYLSKPKDQTTIFNNTQTETFEEFGLGKYSSSLTATDSNGNAFGTYQLSNASQLAILPDDQYGAATGQYASFGAQTGTTGDVVLKLNSPQAYFGFSWNAGDANNNLTFLRNGVVVGSYSTATTVQILSGPKVTAINGQQYNSSEYFGQPSTGLNTGEPYAFINFISTDAFDTVVFSNPATGTGFESDNHTIRAIAPGPDDTFVNVTSAPEPAPVVLAVLLGGGIVGQIVRVRVKNGKKTAA